jgi:hypothetical protein
MLAPLNAVRQGEKPENWLELCLQAADDQNEEKFSGSDTRDKSNSIKESNG